MLLKPTSGPSGRVVLVLGAHLLQELLARPQFAAEQGRAFGLGLLHLPQQGAELLVRPWEEEATGRLLVLLGAIRPTPPAAAQAFLENPALGLAAVLLLDLEADPPRAIGWVRWGVAPVRLLDGLRVIGLGMKDQELVPLPLPDPFERLAEELSHPDRSRVEGALPQTAREALQCLRVLVVGCGGLGSMLAEQVGRLLGRAAQLALLDGDVLEPGNVPAWLDPVLAEANLGHPKAQVLAARLASLPGGPSVQALPGRLEESVASVLAVKDAQLVVCCVDNPEARQVVARLCAFYTRPLLVIETAVVLGESVEAHHALLADAPQSAGLPDLLKSDMPRLRLADVRLVLPWRSWDHPGCLVCAGGVGEPAPSGPFWRGRAGTLPALNQEAVARGIRLMVDFLAGEIRETTHLRLDEAGGAAGTWRTIAHRPVWGCSLCTEMGGGDAAWRKER